MERIVPFEIDHSNLRLSLKGYNQSDVDVLLERIKTEMSSVVSELQGARSEIARQKALIDNYAAQENTLKDALLLAQRTSDEVRANAHREADAVIAQAHRTAEETQRQYQSKINDLRWELERMRMDRQKFQTDFRNLLEAYLRKLAEESAPNGVIEPNENIRAAIESQL